MRRKLVKQGQNALTVTLPAKWTKQNNLKAGDDVVIDIDGNLLNVSTEDFQRVEKKIIVDINGMDRSSFLKVFTSLYESGYDDVRFDFSENQIDDLKDGKKVLLSDQMDKYVKRFEGFAIVSQGQNFYNVRDISVQSEKAFPTIQRRIFFLLLEFNKTIQTCVDKGDFAELHKAQQIHDNITQFVSFCLRLLNKRTVSDVEKYNLYQIINSLDLLVDYSRYLSEDLLKVKKVGASCKKILKRMLKHCEIFYSFFYQSSNDNLRKLMSDRLILKKDIFNTKLLPKEFVLVTKYGAVFEQTFALVKCVLTLKRLGEK